ncbi:MAG: hypothetical protein J6E38_04355 [Clostridia bacterium]|nr:hypothetical protein [Clostridia bacterium]
MGGLIFSLILIVGGIVWLFASRIFTESKFSYEYGNKVFIKFGLIPFFVALVLGVIVLISTSESADSNSGRYDDVFKKNPNEWTEDEEEYVNDFFEWQAKNY